MLRKTEKPKQWTAQNILWAFTRFCYLITETSGAVLDFGDLLFSITGNIILPIPGPGRLVYFTLVDITN